MANKLYLKIVKTDEDEDGNVIELDRISANQKVIYRMPADKRDMKLHHPILLTKKSVQNAAKSISPIGGYRNIQVSLTPDLKALYYDEDDNLAFKDTPLEEIQDELNYSIISNQTDEERRLLNQIAELQKVKQQLESQRDDSKLNDIEKKLIVDKFNGTQIASEWIIKFETECIRWKVSSPVKMIQALRFYVDGSAVDWYFTNLKKLDMSKWSDWRDSLLLIYADKGWSTVRQAFYYKYLAGSLTDYALKKERYCLEMERDMTMTSRINMIVVSLPKTIQDKLDKEMISTMDQLYTELRKLDDACAVRKKASDDDPKVNKFSNVNQSKSRQSYQKEQSDQKTKQSVNKRDSCFMCDLLGLTNPHRFHSPKVCNNKLKYFAKLKDVNLILEKEAQENEDTDELARIMNINVASPGNTSSEN